MSFSNKPISAKEIFDGPEGMPDLPGEGSDSLGFSEEDVAFRARLERLTPREWDVLEHLLAGKTAKQIAQELGTSHNTVRNQRRVILKKLAAESEINLLRRCLFVWLGSKLPSLRIFCEQILSEKNPR